MGIYVTEQARVFLLAVLLGVAVGALYDMVGALRKQWSRATAVLDVGYGLCLLGAIFLFVLRQSQGQLRLFVLLGTLGGSVLFFTGLSGWLRPVWLFWVDSLVWLGQVLVFPGIILGKVMKIFRDSFKKRFYFFQKYCKIRYHTVDSKRNGGQANGEEKTKQKTK